MMQQLALAAVAGIFFGVGVLLFGMRFRGGEQIVDPLPMRSWVWWFLLILFTVTLGVSILYIAPRLVANG